MPWIAAALGLLIAQYAFSCGSPDGNPAGIAALLAGRSATEAKVAITGTVVDAAPTWGRGVRLTVLVDAANGAPSSGLVSVSVRDTARRWRTGDRLALTSRLRRINAFGNFGELDWQAYNARRGVFASAYAWSDDDVRALPREDGVVDAARRRFSEACERSGGQGAEILEALVIGDRTGIERATSDAVRDAGLAHYLAISGSHMALIVALVVALVRWAAGLRPAILERYDVLRAAALLAALAVVAYGAVSGGGVSVARSVLMALAAMAALWRGRPGDDLRALGGSAIVLAAAMPGVGDEAGFQLSYLAVGALILDARTRRSERARQASPGAAPEARSRAGQAADLLAAAARMTLVCWAVTSPIVAYHFQRVSLVAPLANVLAAPLVSAVVVTGLAAFVLLPMWPAGGAGLVAIGAGLSDLVLGISAFCSELPLASAMTPRPGPTLAIALSGVVLASLLAPGRHRRALLGALAAVVAASVAAGVHDRYRSDRLDVWFASVGQGDAAVVRMPGGKVWAIDQGPPGRGRMVVGPLLRRAWIGRVDVLVASHVQSDHAGALPEILEDFDVGEIWLPDGPCDVDAGRALLSEAHERGIPVRFVATGEPKRVAHGATVEVLSPPARAAACNDNDQSLVLKIGFAGKHVLFTGDIEAAAESRLLGGDLRADVLKVPHHGSRTSSTRPFLDAVSPRIAVASLGLDNQFRFPAPEVVERYASAGTRLLRTDLEGAVHVAIGSDGAIAVETFRDGK